jgi:ATP-binding cassette subfamily C protein LapB
VALTRLLLCQSSLWLLDEPTSSMDEGTEERCLMALKQHVRSGQTLVLVTHKARLLDLVDRLVVLTPQGIALDGPKDKVLDALRQRAAAAQQQQSGIVTTSSNLRSSVQAHS